MRKILIYTWIGLSAALCRAFAQSNSLIQNQIIQQTIQATTPPDSTEEDLEFDEGDLKSIVTLRQQFDRQNSGYTIQKTLNEDLLRFLKKDELELSEEALYWAHWVRDASTRFDARMTFRDTVIVNPLFMPIVFKGNYLPKEEDLVFYDTNLYRAQATPYDNLFPTDSVFKDELRLQAIEASAHRYVETNYPTYFRYSQNDLPTELVKSHIIHKDIHEDTPIQVNNEANFEEVDAPQKFIPERRYWTSHFESSVQFAQNYISSNWHKGGTSTLNLTNRQYFVYNYAKDKVQLTNELEWKTNAYTAPKDTLRNYKIGDDVLRLHTNFGYQAYNKWFYSFDFTFQTQLFSNYAENTNNKISAFLAPFSINMGIGMKYDLANSFQGNKHKKLSLALNVAPISYTYMYSIRDDINFGKHGFEQNDATGEFKRSYSKFGSTINATFNFQFNRNVSWYSRFYYFTSYERILGEFENRLNLAISRFFSTTISLNLRYDDAAQKSDDFLKNYLQINELLSFGFNYKW